MSFVSMLTVSLSGYRKLNHLIYASSVMEYSNVHCTCQFVLKEMIKWAPGSSITKIEY